METDSQNFGQEEVKSLHVGLLLLGNDFSAIGEALLPQQKVDDIVHFYCSSYRFTKASAHVQKLQQQGFQPGSLVSGNMRNRLVHKLAIATGRNLKSDKSVISSLKGYDTSSLPLLKLVEVMARETGPATFAKAVYDEMDTCGVAKDQLDLSELVLDWPTFDSKARQDPTLFDTALWPALSQIGWQTEKYDAAAAAEPSDAASQADGDGPDLTSPVAQQQDSEVVYVPPETFTEDYQIHVGSPLSPCRTPQAVMDALADAGHPVPEAAIRKLRELELDDAIQDFMQDPGQQNQHRHAYDPSVKRPGTPTTSRKFMCANCAINSSTVWRTGNAALTLCNACGMFYNKHDHEHRPEHLIASARAKTEAQQAAAASGAIGTSPLIKGSYLRGCTPDSTNTDGELSDDGGARRRGSHLGAEESVDEDDDGAKRPRRRRRAQVNKWLATDDYLMLDGPLRTSGNQNFAAAAAAAGSEPYGYDDSRFDARRARFTASPTAPRRQSRPLGGYRSRSFDRDYYGYAQGRDDDGWDGTYRDEYPHSYVSAGQRGAAYMDTEGNEMDEPAAQLPEEYQRPLEDMEQLLGRILLHTTSDASDSSAADALVAMSQSCITGPQQRRLHAAISSDIRAASGSPAPQSAMRPLPATFAAAAADPASAGHVAQIGGSPLALTGGFEGWDAAATVEILGRSGLGDKKLVSSSGDGPAAAVATVDMDIDPATDKQQKQQQDAADRRVDDEFDQARAKLHPIVTNRDPKTPVHHAGTAAPYNSPQPWYVGLAAAVPRPFHEEPQQCHSAPGHFAAGDCEFGSPLYGQQYRQISGDGYLYHGVASDGEDYADSGSRTASPTRAGKGSRRRPAQADEDYPEPRGKGRTISRFGAEHQQQLDHFGGSRSQPSTPQKRERGSPMPRSVRRTANGEPQRCANCSSEHTCLWRRDKEDPTRTLCNACGIYKTNNGIDRPTNGLFPSWKNGRERVVRRNVARPIFKPNRHQGLSADATGAQKGQDPMRAAAGSPLGKRRHSHAGGAQQSKQQLQYQSGGDIHPGALGFSESGATSRTTPAPAGVDDETRRSYTPSAGPRGVDPAILAELTKVARTSIHGQSTPASSPASPRAAAYGPNAAAVLSAAVVAAASAAVSQAADPILGSQQGVSSTLDTAPARRAAADRHARAATPSNTPAAGAGSGSSGGVGLNSGNAGEVIGDAQQFGEFGVLGALIQQAWAHAVRMHEPVMLPTGHKVFPDGQVVRLQVGNQLGSPMPAGAPAAVGQAVAVRRPEVPGQSQ